MEWQGEKTKEKHKHKRRIHVFINTVEKHEPWRKLNQKFGRQTKKISK